MSDTYQKLIDEAPAYAEKLTTLWDWSLNYEHPSPAALFLDLTGYSVQYFGQPLCEDMSKVITSRLGYLELSMLGQALDEYATRPLDIIEYVEKLLTAETEES